MDRQHILDEIKRTAAENGGVPLGRSRFLQAIGIKPSDWEGRHWVRWGDAVTEAGFSPNRLTTTYGETELIDRYGRACPPVWGVLPINQEIRLASPPMWQPFAVDSSGRRRTRVRFGTGAPRC